MTEQELIDIKERIENATPAPWSFDRDNVVIIAEGAKFGKYVTNCIVRPDGSYYNPEDGEFIAHARQDVPALVAEVERLTAMLENLERQIVVNNIPVTKWDDKCPYCETVIRDIWANSNAAGREVRCWHCGNIVWIKSIGQSLYGLRKKPEGHKS